LFSLKSRTWFICFAFVLAIVTLTACNNENDTSGANNANNGNNSVQVVSDTDINENTDSPTSSGTTSSQDEFTPPPPRNGTEVFVSDEAELRVAIDSAGETPTNIVLTADIELRQTLFIQSDADILLSSEGNNEFNLAFPLPGNNPVIEINEGCTLTIINIGVTSTLEENQRGNRGIRNNGTFIMYGGIISGNGSHQDNGGGVYNSHTGVFVMYGGTISGNGSRRESGGGVYNLGTFDLYGGSIINNFTSLEGGGVYSKGRNEDSPAIFNMHGGIISENNALDGGGVRNDSYSNFNMYGGTIFYNVADSGGGGVANGGNFTMHDGEITINRAEQSGGGLRLDNSNSGFTIYGGWIHGNSAEHNSDYNNFAYTDNIPNETVGGIGISPNF
jgi:hypothetical protein